MRDIEPKTKIKNCTHCDKEFEARRKGIGYTTYCPTCTMAKVWMPGKRGYKRYDQ
jgi:saccharopine dehydrogenase-like NADP-dependent oxidoreductase